MTAKELKEWVNTLDDSDEIEVYAKEWMELEESEIRSIRVHQPPMKPEKGKP